MASTDTESFEACSPTGSVLIYPDMRSSGPAPVHSLPALTDLETALHDDEKESVLPTDDYAHRRHSGDGFQWDTVDPALIRFTLDESDSFEYHTPTEQPNSYNTSERDGTSCENIPATTNDAPFHRWMKTLRRRAAQRRHTATMDEMLFDSPSVEDLRQTSNKSSHLHRRLSSSGSSMGFVEAVKTASVSLASGSILARSRRNSMRSSRTRTQTDRSSRASTSSNRCSEDSVGLDKPIFLDKAAVERSLQRRRILEELISTEEGYIGDVRFLMNVYVTILVSLPTMPLGLRSSINQNLAAIVELHEEILGDLHRAVPHSEYTQMDLPLHPKDRIEKHKRIRSLDAVPEDDESMSWLEAVPGMVAEPNIAADVAKIFTDKMNRFFLYEEYGAKYEMMIRDIASTHRTMPQWETYQKGLETLAASVGPSGSRAGKSKKSLTIGDLLVKPIQRVCKYPLLFAELLKYTPVADSPYAHMEIEGALIRLREATSQINRATNDARVKAVLEKTWKLQDRLVFPESKLDAASKNRIRSFGHIQLCGVLYACWQAKGGVIGQYMVTLLYKDWLCLASASKADQIYTLQACIPLSQIKIEAMDNGRGLQCHTAPFSWKIVFECDYQLYEIMLTACSPKEEDEWRARLEVTPTTGPQEQAAHDLYSSIFLDIKSLGTVFGKQGGIARKISIHRATTVSPKTPLCNIVVRHTSVDKEVFSSSHPSINRSQSLLATKGRVTVLAPARADRARVEALLADVWSRETLPFPGMTTRARNERLIRTSAHSMIRKLSATSIASTFTKRSASLASITGGCSDEDRGEDEESSEILGTPELIQEGTSASLGPGLDDVNEHSASRLSIIEDISDHTTPSTLRACSIENPGYRENSRSPRRRLRIIKSPSVWQLREVPAFSASPSTPTTALHPKSANGPVLKRQASLLSRRSARSARSARSVCSAIEGSSGRRSSKRRAAGYEEAFDAAEDYQQVLARASTSTSSTAASPSKNSVGNRWSRVDMLRRGAVAEGIRGFFR